MQYSLTGSNANHLGEGKGKDRVGRAVDKYVPVRVGTSELKKVESNLGMHWSEVMISSMKQNALTPVAFALHSDAGGRRGLTIR